MAMRGKLLNNREMINTQIIEFFKIAAFVCGLQLV